MLQDDVALSDGELLSLNGDWAEARLGDPLRRELQGRPLADHDPDTLRFFACLRFVTAIGEEGQPGLGAFEPTGKNAGAAGESAQVTNIHRGGDQQPGGAGLPQQPRQPLLSRQVVHGIHSM